jgi:hypothetical protein
MNDPLKEILKLNAKTYLFPPNSRYQGIDTATLETDDGKVVAYLRRRFIPQMDSLALLQEHTVLEGERLDHLAAKYMGDPLQFWRICDANECMDPSELTKTAGKKIRITLPEGMPGIKYG